MKSLSEQQYTALIQDAEIIEQDEVGPRVLMLSDGTILKIFKQKKLLSSATIVPYSTRFARNARTLHTRNIPTMRIIEVARIPHLKVTSVQYEPLPGSTLRSCGKETASLPEDTITGFAAFVATLHDQGTYFRSFHLANVIVTQEETFGLIDIADLWVKNRPLTFKERFRNFDRIYRYSDDIKLLRSAGDTLFIDHYLKTIQVDAPDAWRTQLQTQQDELLKTRRSLQS